MVGDRDAEGEGVVGTEGEVGEVDAVFGVGEGGGIGGAVEVGADGCVVDDGELGFTEEEVAVGEAQGDGRVGCGLADEDGQGIGLRAVEFDHFAA